jgi:hypothetical protein
MMLFLKKPYGVSRAALLFFIAFAESPVFARQINLQTHWKDQVLLENPQKGWYRHHPDPCLTCIGNS